jgi:hypothetical protein
MTKRMLLCHKIKFQYFFPDNCRQKGFRHPLSSIMNLKTTSEIGFAMYIPVLFLIYPDTKLLFFVSQ